MTEFLAGESVGFSDGADGAYDSSERFSVNFPLGQ